MGGAGGWEGRAYSRFYQPDWSQCYMNSSVVGLEEYSSVNEK